MGSTRNEALPDVVLDLSEVAPDLADHPLVKLPDGELYPMMLPDGFTVGQLIRLEKMQERLNTLVAEEEAAGALGDEGTPTREAEMSRLYGALMPMILPTAPRPLLDALPDGKRLQLMMAFSAVLAIMPRRTRTAAPRAGTAKRKGRTGRK